MRVRARKSSGQAHANTRQLFALWLSQNGKCGLTGLSIVGTPQLDHIVPVSKGGAHTVDNLQWTEKMANNAKNSHSVEEFRTWLLAAAEALKQKMQLEELL